MPERFLEGRTALVTGSVQGIGLAIGKALASAAPPGSRPGDARASGHRRPHHARGRGT